MGSATRALLCEPERPSALIYDSDVMAVAGLAVATEMGVSVPGDLSIVSFEDSLLTRIVHPAITEHPTAAWTAQQVIDAFPYDTAPRWLVRDRDAIYGDEFRRRWQRQVPGVPLVIVESPYRALVGPLTAYLNVLDLAWPPDKPAPVTIVVLPEFVVRHWWDRLLYNQSAKRLKSALVGREHTVIADVPYRRGH